MRKLSTILFLLVVAGILMSSKPHHTIFIIGDSTAANKDIRNGNPERGWGMVLQGCFDERILIDNHAVNGRSSKSFLDEGRWKTVFDKIKPGDYVFIQFGHNDEKPRPALHTDPGSTFDENLRLYVRQTREKGGIPVLFNAVVRRYFFRKTDASIEDESLRQTTYQGETVNSDTLIDTHGAYLDSPQRVAQEMKVPFVNANQITHDIEQGMGIVGSRKLHMWFLPGECPAIPQGRQDNTHYNIFGAHVVSNALADEIARQVPALKKYIRHYDYVVSKLCKGNYMTLQSAVDAIPSGSRATVLVLDGTWEKPRIPADKHIKWVTFSSVVIR